MEPLARVDAALARFYRGRSWLLAVDVVQAYRGMHRHLMKWGAEDCFVVGARMGTGTPPDENVVWRCLNLPPAGDLMEAIHGADRALGDVPPDVQRDIDAFDPEGTMGCLGLFFASGRPVAGRRVVGARPGPWQALEDKTVIDALWDAVGVPRAPCLVVDATQDALDAAAAAVDQGHGTVWAGDAREGFHGGAACTYWVVSPEERQEAWEALAARCDCVRVMPFLEGIPCSIHGVVLPDGVAVFRPAEMLVLRRGRRFVYARAGTYWDPPEAHRESLRAMARRAGEHLQRTLGYRGAFTIDGVLTAEGFLPTELNPRVGAAMGMLAPEVPFPLLHYALIEGVELDVPHEALEAAVLAHADAHRVASWGFTVPKALDASQHRVSWQGRWELAAEGEGEGSVMVGLGPTGGFINVQLDPGHVPLGPSLAPRVAAFADWADARFGTSIGPLQCPRDVHREVTP